MRKQLLAGILTTAVLVGVPALAPAAAAQPAPRTEASGSYIIPVVIGAAAGATVGALIWPAAPAAAVAAAAPAAASLGWGAFLTTRAAVGAVIGGGLGYLVSR